MAPSSARQILLSPAELSYIHTSLSHTPPIRSDGRQPNQFRPLTAEAGILPSTNGSARICFADGTEAVVGVKAEVEKSWSAENINIEQCSKNSLTGPSLSETDKKGLREWVDVSVEIPGIRDDESMPIFLAALLSEALLADGIFTKKLWINNRFHWRLYLDILLLSPPLSYPLPLLSLTMHLALLSTRLPKLKSEGDEDPLFEDDWEVSTFLYPRGNRTIVRPPITLLVISVKDNIIFDPSKEELAVAEVVLAISVGEGNKQEGLQASRRDLRLLAARTIDPPSRLTYPGVSASLNPTMGGMPGTYDEAVSHKENCVEEGVWIPPRGGAKRKLISAMIQQVLSPGGIADEVLDGLDAVELG